MLWDRSAVCLHTRCEMVILCVFLSQHWRSLYVHVICPVSSRRWCFQTNAVTVRARYLPCFLTTLVLSKEAVSVSARYLTCFLTTLVLSHKCSQCTCTLFVPSWCCQINQSLYVHSICSKLVLSDKPVSVCAYYLLCPLTTLLLSDKPVPLSTLFAMPAHNVGAVRRSCLCTACILFSTTG